MPRRGARREPSARGWWRIRCGPGSPPVHRPPRRPTRPAATQAPGSRPSAARRPPLAARAGGQGAADCPGPVDKGRPHHHAAVLLVTLAALALGHPILGARRRPAPMAGQVSYPSLGRNSRQGRGHCPSSSASVTRCASTRPRVPCVGRHVPPAAALAWSRPGRDRRHVGPARWPRDHARRARRAALAKGRDDAPRHRGPQRTRTSRRVSVCPPRPSSFQGENTRRAAGVIREGQAGLVP